MSGPTNVELLQEEGWELAGYCGVDAGLIHIGDPCYLSNGQGPYQDWTKFCRLLGGKMGAFPLDFEQGHPGLGVVVESGYGDGYYPVMVRYETTEMWGKRVAEARILFIQADEEEEGED